MEIQLECFDACTWKKKVEAHQRMYQIDAKDIRTLKSELQKRYGALDMELNV